MPADTSRTISGKLPPAADSEPKPRADAAILSSDVLHDKLLTLNKKRSPIVVVPADRRRLLPHTCHVVGEKYLQALVAGSGVFPMIVPALPNDFDSDDVLQVCAGIFLTGSYSNVQPHHYGSTASAEGSLHDAERDAVTLPLLRRALEVGVPLLAVCRGYQELNVALGGTLHQNVATVEGYHNHAENKDDPLDVQYGPSHPVTLMDGGLLRQFTATDTVTVNSVHEQGVAQLAAGVTVEAVADDGLIEAFRLADAPGFNLAVQWHPEWCVKDDQFSLAIFKAFGAACREYANQRQV